VAVTPSKSAKSRAEQEAAEYSTWRAVVPIPHGNTIAYQPGHAVPVSNVEQYGYDKQGLVERISGEEQEQAAQAAPPLTV
jgi:hypothetical protein